MTMCMGRGDCCKRRRYISRTSEFYFVLRRSLHVIMCVRLIMLAPAYIAHLGSLLSPSISKCQPACDCP
jgi:hypothetical protein